MFRPSNPQNKYLTEMEVNEWRREREEKKKEERRSAVRFWITTAIAAVAALTGIVGIVLQFALRQ